MIPAIVTPTVLAGFSDVVHVAGLAAFFAGIAVGMLFVFADRHGYERPAPPRIVAILLAVGAILTIIAWIRRHLGI